MILASFLSKNVVAILFVTLAVLVLVIAYRKLLAYMGKGRIPKEKYCVLHAIEKQPASGELEFYFTSEEKKHYELNLLNEDLSLKQQIAQGESKIGGNIIRFDSSNIPNGVYFYQLMTDNQKTSKKIIISNS